MGPALAVAMLTILYGYSIKLITIALAKDLKPVKEWIMNKYTKSVLTVIESAES